MERGGKAQLIWDFCAHWRKNGFFDNLHTGSRREASGARPAVVDRSHRPLVCLILRGKKIGYAAIRELLSGNTRQGNGRASAYCRVLPDIAA